MNLTERLKKRAEQIHDRHAEDYSNNGIQEKKVRLKAGFVTVGVDLEKQDKRKLNIIAVMQNKKKREITETAIRDFLNKYDESGMLIDTNKKE